MRLAFGIFVFFLGLWLLRWCYRRYRDDFGGALVDDISDYLSGQFLAIVCGVFVTLFGAALIIYALVPDTVIRFSGTFPYVSITRQDAPPR